MLNCTDAECTLHHHHIHVDPIQHHLQDDRQHHEHSSVMSSDAANSLNDIYPGFINSSANPEYSSEHVDVPNEGVYMVCGVLIAMVLVAVIIVILAVTISKLRKREETAVAAAATAAATAVATANTAINNNNNNNNNVDCQLPHAQPVDVAVVTNVSGDVGDAPVPLPFLWQYSAKNAAAKNTNGYNSPYRLYSSDQDTLVCSVPIEETAEHRKGLRKNLRGKWRRLVHKKQQQQDAYKIPAELRDQLKQIYVY
ncbi:uncharacterized protein LOC113554639 isoform X1 [Rhopalosiphum maidis]|uniref:uncharacterized protein LOC113554639 isoform X1 n=2 Tax=Rhopalosiphum maidis TaxID=43146 RepID=UPI000EFDD424|nr:uncharacterized protein LOC113554639 isoform X1 [Rhopalosiphum maidis]XP_026814367.1 uncharacterized protein LOC113554639 isoform X1 [Rhopalosiphum maidis]